MKDSATNIDSIVSAISDPAMSFGNDGSISFANEAMQKLLGKTKAQLSQLKLSSIFNLKNKKEQVWEKLQSTGFIRKLPCTLISNTTLKLEISGLAVRKESGEIIVAMLIAENITVSKTEQRELREAILKAELATKIAEEAQSLAEQAVMTAADSVKAKQQFLSNMSHEIRTPMNAIIGFTKVVMKTDLTAKQREYLTAIKLSGDALIVLINDILDLAKVNAGKMAFEEVPFRLSASIAAMLHLFEPKVEEKNIELIKNYDPSIPEVLLGDSVSSESNHFKFSEQCC